MDRGVCSIHARERPTKLYRGLSSGRARMKDMAPGEPALNGPTVTLEDRDLLGLADRRIRNMGAAYSRRRALPTFNIPRAARHAFVSAANEIGTTQSVKTARLRCGIVPFTRLPSHGEGHMLGIIARRQFITLLGGAAWPLAAAAQQPERMRRIGVLMKTAADEPEPQGRPAAVMQGPPEVGWAVGRNMRMDYRWSVGDVARLRKDATELVALGPEVILAGVGSTTQALQQASRTVPIVMAQGLDPVGNGYVDSLARPGGNIT